MTVGKKFKNPIINRDLPDPHALILAGTAYLYGTESLEENVRTIHVTSSTDFKTWEPLRDAFAEKPQWTRASCQFWGPDVSFQNGEYWMYYSADPEGERYLKKIGLAKSKTPYDFVDVGQPIDTPGWGYSDIDPHPFRDPKTGDFYLFCGSMHHPIKARRLKENGYQFVDDTVHEVLYPLDRPYFKLLEGFHLIYHDEFDKYFAFVSGDSTFGNYAVLGFWADSPLGPFTPLPDGHEFIVKENNRWRKPGQNSVFKDASGEYWIVYHATDSKHRRVQLSDESKHLRRVSCAEKLDFSNGYPRVATGTPCTVLQDVPIL